jgi:N-acetylglucosaminyldiphosphoundecaprenol N-acetyl-beta-D-mannosaminyltransferase
MASTILYIDTRSAVSPHQPLSPRRATAHSRVYFGAIPVDRVTMAQATGWLMGQIRRRGLQKPALVVGPNAYLVTLGRSNPRFAEAMQAAALCLADGISVVWASRMLGKPIAERVPGGEFMEEMCALGGRQGLSVYFLGGLPGAADTAAARLAARYPGLVIAGTDCPAPGFESDPAAIRKVLAKITAARPDLLCVAFGAPRQEIWMHQHCSTLPIGAALSVGAAFDTQAGLRKRAPKWTHAIGAEWLYRLCMEPRRLWKRYLIGNSQFAAIVASEWWQRRKDRAVANQMRRSSV